MGRKKKGCFSRSEILGTISNGKQEPEACYPITKTTRQRRKQSETDPFPIVEEENHDDSLDILEDIDELSRLMSVVEIDDDPKEFEKQLNLAGNHRPFIFMENAFSLIAAYHHFLICLPSTIHPAVKGHLIERFKALVEFPSHPSLESFPSITPASIQEKLNNLSEESGVSFGLILAPPTSHCLKV